MQGKDGAYLNRFFITLFKAIIALPYLFGSWILVQGAILFSTQSLLYTGLCLMMSVSPILIFWPQYERKWLGILIKSLVTIAFLALVFFCVIALVFEAASRGRV